MKAANDPGPEGESDLGLRRKRARVRAWRRGIREMDLVMGRFADHELAGLSEAELTELEQLMDLPDQQVLAWVVGQARPPADRDTPLLARLRSYRPPLS